MLLKRPAIQQQGRRSITGTIIDQFGITLIGANVIEKGTTNGTVTDLDGNFSLQVFPNAILQISHIGFISKEVPVGTSSTLSITLEEDTKALDEVVVVGYGTQRKKDLTGAVAQIGGDDLIARKTTQVSQALQGAIPGVSVTRSNNAPGASATVRIRGITTIGDTNPLIIVDGMQVDNMNDVNPNDIENISVLKDAASSSIYGSQAAAGVVLITTKRAKSGQFSIEYNYEYGMEIPTKNPGNVDVIRFMEMTNELRWNDAGNGADEYPTYSKDMIENYDQLNRENPNRYPNTDWLGLILKSYAPRQSHIIKMTGGNEKIRTAASIAYDDIGALYDNRSYQRITSRINNDLKFNKYLSASLDVSYKRTIDKQASENPMHYARISAPVYAATWADGRIAEGKTGANMYAQVLYGGYKHYWYNQLNARMSLDFTPIEGLKISGVFSPIMNDTKEKLWRTRVPWYSADDPSVLGGYTQWGSTTRLEENRRDNHRLTTQFLANYDKSIADHTFNIMAGYENRYAFNEDLMASRGNYELTSFPYLSMGPQELRDNSGTAYEYVRRSFFGRAMYNYKSKYLFQANMRYDASSRFADGHRWGVFPSVSLGWVLSEESFMKDYDWLSFLKLRGSWGTLGNERTGSWDGSGNWHADYYPYQARVNAGNSLFFAGNEVVSRQGMAQQVYVIRDITWETTESFDIGIDAHFLNNRLRFTGDYYKKKTRDMLLTLQIPTFMGFDNPQQNTGKMNTTGWEAQIGWYDRMGDWSYYATFNISDFKSEMGNLGGTQFLGEKIKTEGSEFDEWYGYRCLGIYQTQEQVDNSAKTSNSVKVGDLWYEDISGPDGTPDGIISPEYDRVLLGGSLPRYSYGATIGASYKNFDFGLTIQGVGKQNQRILGEMVEPLRENWGNVPSLLDGNVFSHYNTPEQNLSAKYPRLTRIGDNYTMSDFWMFNGWYMRLKNVNIGYSLPTGWANKIQLQGLRVYMTATDLFSLSKFPEGWDPEMRSGEYPITTSLLFGVSIKF
jgi:TonB-linked SusC/RagA family outer membrane protein